MSGSCFVGYALFWRVGAGADVNLPRCRIRMLATFCLGSMSHPDWNPALELDDWSGGLRLIGSSRVSFNRMLFLNTGFALLPDSSLTE